MTVSEDPYLTSLKADGFVVVRNVVSGDALKALQEAAIRTANKARAGDWPHVRTVGKQFPPWDRWDRAAAEKAKASNGVDQPGIWGVQHLMCPEMGAQDAGIFTQSYFAQDGVLDVAKRVLACSDDDLVMELYNMLVRPDYKDYELRWHRDDIGPDATPAEEMERLQAPAFHAQWNLALWDDASLIVVPGSHKRARTEGERAADPYQATLPCDKAAGHRPQLTVQLGPGDAVFYNNNILHRGVYQTAVERTTLHGSVGHVGGNALRARNVLQHGVGDWVERCDFSVLTETERARAEGMRARLIKMGRESGPVGYSLKD
ncbi:hypothetical protein HMPREF1624_04265 [Sporothrix schenckii ATCC 58251]|uniref:Phytanoyl-CoA dioxygenase n=1 Tax=Sporothrix schenckii (strain ATCC 58251 / de Perez 2211183) TaxID=1391915 RepID=U7PX84_SPOS1|nr:hypothetical protein HMPREF1624_04265 [Sporothrix schenckii ATCC 58251]